MLRAAIAARGPALAASAGWGRAGGGCGGGGGEGGGLLAAAAARGARGLAVAAEHAFELVPGMTLGVTCTRGAGVVAANGPHDRVALASSGGQLAVSRDGAAIGARLPRGGGGGLGGGERGVGSVAAAPPRVLASGRRGWHGWDERAVRPQTRHRAPHCARAPPAVATEASGDAGAVVRVQLPMRFCGLSVATAGGAVELAGQLNEAPLDVRSMGGAPAPGARGGGGRAQRGRRPACSGGSCPLPDSAPQH
jgi:hypothetical protein